jgi:hypothetical protein
MEILDILNDKNKDNKDNKDNKISYRKAFMFANEASIKIVLIESIEKKHNDRLEILKSAIDCGFNVNNILDKKNDLRLIHLLANSNDLLLVGYLTKNTDCKINVITKNKENVAHICAYRNNYHLLKYFLQQKNLIK